ncbi:Fur family transcriptional regulator [Campylobacter mucosalis]|uniref:Fur family transcriptional regulator n=1 Tax=Campylobacter mucosalis TaxID=202 RepID=UPI00147033EC|nr:transcriptional repressor [Campylobacter mucosalis]
MNNFDNFYKNFSAFLSELNHKNSYIKERILNILYTSEKHLSANEIQLEFQKRFKDKISLPAIYTLLNFLDECHLTNTYEDNGIKKYELNLSSHHDHIICEKCQKVIEFHDDVIEEQQENIAKAKGFEIKTHSMILYGICDECIKR